MQMTTSRADYREATKRWTRNDAASKMEVLEALSPLIARQAPLEDGGRAVPFATPSEDASDVPRDHWPYSAARYRIFRDREGKLLPLSSGLPETHELLEDDDNSALGDGPDWYFGPEHDDDDLLEGLRNPLIERQALLEAGGRLVSFATPVDEDTSNVSSSGNQRSDSQARFRTFRDGEGNLLPLSGGRLERRPSPPPAPLKTDRHSRCLKFFLRVSFALAVVGFGSCGLLLVSTIKTHEKTVLVPVPMPSSAPMARISVPVKGVLVRPSHELVPTPILGPALAPVPSTSGVAVQSHYPTNQDDAEYKQVALRSPGALTPLPTMPPVSVNKFYSVLEIGCMALFLSIANQLTLYRLAETAGTALLRLGGSCVPPGGEAKGRKHKNRERLWELNRATQPHVPYESYSRQRKRRSKGRGRFQSGWRRRRGRPPRPKLHRQHCVSRRRIRIWVQRRRRGRPPRNQRWKRRRGRPPNVSARQVSGWHFTPSSGPM